MNSLPEIAQLGASVLRQQAAYVNNIHDLEVVNTIAAMQAALAATQGVGLAAAQIGIAKRIIIVASRPTVRYPNAPAMPPTIMINPEYQPLSEEIVKDWEGCLSIPGIRALVPRYQTIAIQFVNVDGEIISETLDNFVARIFQHEFDHLEGMVYLDRVENSKDIISESEYLKLFV